MSRNPRAEPSIPGLLRRGVVASLAVATVTACTAAGMRTSTGASSVPADDRARITAATQHYAALLRGAPVDSIVAVYAEDGELTIPGVGTLRGRKAIHDFLAPLAANVTVTSAEMQIDSLTVTGGSAVSRGRYRELAGPTGSAPQEFRGAFDATWTRGPDAQWRLARLVMQPNVRTQ